MTDTAPRTFAEAQVQLARSLPGYESRPQQVALAGRVEDLMQRAAAHAPIRLTGQAPRPYHLYGQAGTGTGKSLAYLIPAIQFAAQSGRRVVVSVTTRALQSQLCEKDLPFLQEHLGVPFRWAQLQGRGRYFCAHRADAADESDVPHLGAMRAQVEQGWSGLREALPFEVTDREWSMVRASADDCRDNECSSLYKDGDESCRAQHARSLAARAQIVVVNHALLCTDLVVRSQDGPGMLGDYDVVVLDEAHEFEEVAGDCIGAQFTEASFRALATELRNWVARFTDDSRDFEALAGELVNCAEALFACLPEARIVAATLAEHVKTFRSLVNALEELRTVWEFASHVDQIVEGSDYARAKKRQRSLTNRLNRLAEAYYLVIEAPFVEVVRWVEVEQVERGGKKEPRKVLRTAPVSVAKFLDENLFSQIPTALVSATLATEGDFGFIDGRLGVGPGDSIDVGTPFDYGTQARLYVPTHLPEPRGRTLEQWEAESAEEMLELIRAAGGRSLVLFTSRKHMTKTLGQIRRRIGFTTLVQGEDALPKLIGRFLAEETSVLFGMKSLMTGFDPRGRTCSMVIIAKMPFPVPSEPLTEARTEAIDAAGGNSFNQYTMPIMSLVLQQAAGRLIRHRDDHGVVAILDPRIATKYYGKKIIRDLPPMPRVADLAEAERFLAQHLDPVGA